MNDRLKKKVAGFRVNGMMLMQLLTKKGSGKQYFERIK